ATDEATANALTKTPIRSGGTCKAPLICGSTPAGSRSVITSMNAAVARASSPHSGNRGPLATGAQIVFADCSAGTRPSCNLHINVKAIADISPAGEGHENR